MIGVEPQAGNDVQQSFRRGEIVRIETPRTIADGAQTTAPGPITFALIRKLVADIVTVNDRQLVSTMKFFASRMKLLVEPTGCLGAAAALEEVVPMRGRRVGVLISGGNVDLERFCRLVLRQPVTLFQLESIPSFPALARPVARSRDVKCRPAGRPDRRGGGPASGGGLRDAGRHADPVRPLRRDGAVLRRRAVRLEPPDGDRARPTRFR